MKTKQPEVLGEATKMGTSMVESAAAALQSFGPVNKIHQHLCAFHFYGHDMTRQVEAHHYCGHQNEEMRQCLIYDSPDAKARLIGVEYIISEGLFRGLPDDDEKRMWHSHEYEVKSGVLFLPGVPGPIERQDLAKVAQTYGKTYHFWQVDRGDALPLGLPQLMMALTRDAQLYDTLLHDVENKYGVNMAKERENRAYMKGPEHGVDLRANGGGRGIQTMLREVDCGLNHVPGAGGAPQPRVFV